MSSLAAHAALKDVEANVMGMAALFTYGFPVAEENFTNAQCDLVTLSDYPSLLERAQELQYIQSNELDLLNQWRSNPSTWGQ